MFVGAVTLLTGGLDGSIFSLFFGTYSPDYCEKTRKLNEQETVNSFIINVMACFFSLFASWRRYYVHNLAM